MGWASKASPVRKGLEAWRAASRQDMNSWSESFEIPKELLLALEKRQPDADWSGVMKLASRFSVLAADAGGKPTAATSPQLTPGPRQ
ncbi:hypothetical protein D3C83_19280 [compost metagenome]